MVHHQIDVLLDFTKGLDQGANKDVVYRTVNVYCPDRFIFFL